MNFFNLQREVDAIDAVLKEHKEHYSSLQLRAWRKRRARLMKVIHARQAAHAQLEPLHKKQLLLTF